MAETKPEQTAEMGNTRVYELLSLIPNKYTDEEVPGIMDQVKGLIEKQGGKVQKEVNYGKRRLAYPVNHNHYGTYVLHHFEAEPQATKALDKELRVHDQILRHLMTIAIPEELLPKDGGDLRQEEQQQKTQEEKPMKKPTITDAQATTEEKAKMAKGTKFDLEKELGVTADEAKVSLEEEGKEKAKSDASVDLKQLDTKLDEIMGDLE